MTTKRYIDNSKEVSVEDAIALLKGEAQGLYDWFNGWRINRLTGEWLHEETGITGAEVDEIDQTTGKSESQPDFSLVELTLNSADIALEKVYGESPEWYVNEIALEDFTNGVYPISDLIEKD